MWRWGKLALAFEAAAASASIAAHAIASTYRADIHLRRGAFAEAEADARAALELVEEHRLQFPAALAYAWLVKAQIERGEASEARTMLRDRRWLSRTSSPCSTKLALGCTWSNIRLAAQWMTHWRRAACWRRSGLDRRKCPWRTTAAIAAKQAGEDGQATQLAEEDLELARRFGAPRTLGVSLRTSALVGAGDPVPLLRESAAVLASSGARAERTLPARAW